MQHEYIRSQLEQLEKEKDIRILLACETGSRAWGFPSPDSDYDVRIIYCHPQAHYLRLDAPKDTIELMLDDNELDITGWDLKKALQLLARSNAALLERIQSPIIYKSDPHFLSGIQEIAPHFYKRIACMHHYLSMTKRFYTELKEQPEYRLKKLFYCLRSSIATKWILHREEMVPIVFEKMLDTLDIEEDILARIRELITLKATQNESYMHQGEEALLHFIQASIKAADAAFNTLPGSKGKIEMLNDFFRSQIMV